MKQNLSKSHICQYLQLCCQTLPLAVAGRFTALTEEIRCDLGENVDKIAHYMMI